MDIAHSRIGNADLRKLRPLCRYPVDGGPGQARKGQEKGSGKKRGRESFRWTVRCQTKTPDPFSPPGYDPHIDLYDPTDPRFQPGSPTYSGPRI
jgi:hypothetical protein